MFSVRQAISDADLTPFPFEDADGVQRELPHMKQLTAGQLNRVLRGGELVEVLTEHGVNEAVTDAVSNWPGHVFEPLIRDWMEHSDVRFPGGEPGKSSSSSPSSPSTAASSRRTSRGGASTSRR